MGRGARLLRQLRPYSFLFVANIGATLMASVLDGVTFVLMIPFLRAVFGREALPSADASTVERILGIIAGPLLSGGASDIALRNVVLIIVGALILKNAFAYAASLFSVRIQEGVV